MNIYLKNINEPIQFPQSITLDDGLEQLKKSADTKANHFAIIINDCLIPRSLYKSTMLKENDVVEFIFPMQGG